MGVTGRRTFGDREAEKGRRKQWLRQWEQETAIAPGNAIRQAYGGGNGWMEDLLPGPRTGLEGHPAVSNCSDCTSRSFVLCLSSACLSLCSLSLLSLTEKTSPRNPALDHHSLLSVRHWDPESRRVRGWDSSLSGEQKRTMDTPVSPTHVQTFIRSRRSLQLLCSQAGRQ